MNTFGLQEIVAIGGTIAFNSLAQILLRFGLRDVDIAAMVGNKAFGDLIETVTKWPVLAGVTSFVIGLGFWFVAISRLPTSLAYPMISLAYVVVVILGWLLLNEQIGWQKLTGTGVIIVGVAIISKSA